MKLKEILETATGEVFYDDEEQPHRISLAPGLSGPEIAELEKAVGHSLPEDVAELVAFAGGLELCGREICFTRNFEWTPLDNAFPHAIWLQTADVLDDWFVDVNQQTGHWGPVYFFSHDPAVFVYEFDDLTDFLTEWLRDHGEEGSARMNAAREAAITIWYRQGPMRWSETLVDSDDPALSAFAKQLPSGYLIADLRSRESGLGVPWGWDNVDVKRYDDELLFAIRPGWIRRLLRFVSR
jgi:hypothetical protein